MREEFLEPLPTPQTNAKLLMGNEQVVCVIVEVTADGFRVAVPGVDQYEGDPRLTLVTPGANYPVRLVLQEPHVGGYSYRLQRIEKVVPPDGRPRLSDRFRLVTSSCCAAGLISAMTASCYCIPQSGELVALLTRRSLRYESTGTWSPSIAENDRLPTGISADKSLREDDALNIESREFRGNVQTVSVSMVSPDSMSSCDVSNSEVDELIHAAVRRGNEEQAIGSSIRKPRRDFSLKTLLEEGQVGRVQPAGRELLSWLNGSAPAVERVAFRLSDAAWLDLQQFEIGLKDLPGDSSAPAIDGLRRTLFSVSSDLHDLPNASDSQVVFVVTSDNASIYFRKVHGQIEIVRVLPIGLNKVESP